MHRDSARGSEAVASVVVVEPTGSRVSRIAAPSPVELGWIVSLSDPSLAGAWAQIAGPLARED
jgi:hypothetical protein